MQPGIDTGSRDRHTGDTGHPCGTIHTSMLKAITLIKRRHSLTTAEFQDHWLCNHTQVIRLLPGVLRYVQNHPLPESYAGGEALFDGIAELWGEDTNAFRNMAADAAYADVLADEKAFLDRDSLQLVMTSEHLVNDGPVPAGAIKMIDCYQRKRGMAVDEFQGYWLEQHGPQLAGLPGLRRCVQSTARPGGYGTDHAPAYDGFASSWYAGLDDLRRAMDSDRHARIMEDWKNFIDTRVSIVCREHVLID